MGDVPPNYIIYFDYNKKIRIFDLKVIKNKFLLTNKHKMSIYLHKKQKPQIFNSRSRIKDVT